ncbi:hypothetical protein [Endozoicomonas sp. Mp262]|uniref:hypothetical protein n=1 Tax=Endozoicomonas sp. Mp262 TaxID=2919499 RepID=UPI0021DA42C4
MKYLINGMVMLIFFLSKSLLAVCPDPNCGVIIEHTKDTGKHKSECRLLLQHQQLSDKLCHIREPEPEKLPMSLESINSIRKEGTLHQNSGRIEPLNLIPIFQPEEIDFLLRLAAQALPITETDFKLTVPSGTLTDSVSIVRLYLTKPIASKQDHHQEYGKFLALTAICCLMIISEAEVAEDLSPKAQELSTAINILWNIAWPEDNDAPPDKPETIESDRAGHHETRESIEKYFKDRLSEINKCKEFHIDPKSPPSPDDLLRTYLDHDETDTANGVLKLTKEISPTDSNDSSGTLLQKAVDEISTTVFIKCFHKHKQCFLVSRDFYLQAPFPFPENQLMPIVDSILEVRRRQRNIQSFNRSLSQHDQRPENTRHSQKNQHQPVEPRIVFPWHRALMPISAILCSAGHAIWRKEVKPYHFIIPVLTIAGELARLSLEPGSTQPKRQTHRKPASTTASTKSSLEAKE